MSVYSAYIHTYTLTLNVEWCRYSCFESECCIRISDPMTAFHEDWLHWNVMSREKERPSSHRLRRNTYDRFVVHIYEQHSQRSEATTKNGRLASENRFGGNITVYCFFRKWNEPNKISGFRRRPEKSLVITDIHMHWPFSNPAPTRSFAHSYIHIRCSYRTY